LGGGFTTGGTAWYRKTFTVSTGERGKRVIIRFDGVYMNSTIFINGVNIGQHPYGYTSFYYDITDHIKFGGVNVIAVEVKNEGQNSRWYSGSGIYRHVWLKLADPISIDPWTTSISTPDVTALAAKVKLKVNFLNKSGKDATVKFSCHIYDKENREVAIDTDKEEIGKGDSSSSDYQMTIKNPELWSCESPNLYTAVTELYHDGKLADREVVKFGIRTISFDVQNGFMLNGKTVKLKGGCFHNDNGPLGAGLMPSVVRTTRQARLFWMPATGWACW
jgi:beta-galactosidase